MSRAATPAFSLEGGSIDEMDEEAFNQDQDSGSEYIICDYCGDTQADYKCDLCSKDLCGECNVVKNNGTFRWDFCADCMRKYYMISKAHHKKISAFKQSRTVGACDICHHTVTEQSRIKNGDEVFCAPCVIKFGNVYREQKDVVDEIRERKA
jgi:hypothetical protein